MLSDSVLHGLLIETGDQLLLPFAWRGIRLHATGAAALRARAAAISGPPLNEAEAAQHRHPGHGRVPAAGRHLMDCSG
ncbi:hypothetical protein [Streptomyces chrestomyceticus]|uniref:hypothetical protein n=1 Tax=Streptomyces chrestomyceticus TaxID=68185 RepID=UPI0037B7798D